MNQSLIAALAAVLGVIAVVADGRSSVRVVAVLCGLALAPAAGSVGGSPAALVPLLMGGSVVLTAGLAQLVAQRLPAVPGLDPLVPVIVPPHGLFGPRSIRVFAAVVALPGASWVSLNLSVGGAAVASGAVFAAAYIWLVGVIRLVRGRALEELAVGAVAVSLAAATGWLLEAGPGSAAEAAVVAALAPAAGLVAGWMTGRHRRRPLATA